MNDQKQISSFMRDCLMNSRAVPQPDEDVLWSTLERDQGNVSLVNEIERAVRGANPSDPQGNGPSRIDKPLRNVFINTFYQMHHVGNYYAGLFVPETKDKKIKRQLLQVWDILIRNTILGSVYVGYGEDLIELDRQLIQQKQDSEGSADGFDNAQLTCPFRLYTRSGKGKFYSILAASNIDNAPELEDRLVKFHLRDSNYWLEWWHILTETLGGYERVKVLAKFAAVRTIVSVDGGDDDLMKELYGAMEGGYPILKRKSGIAKIKYGGSAAVQNDYQPHEFTPLDAPRQLLEFYITFFDLMTDKLGYAGKSSPHKMERLTHQESLQGSNVVSTIQYYICQRINSCFDVCREIMPDAIPDDLEIIITNRSAAMAIAEPGEDVRDALGQNKQTPNKQNEQGYD